jgi:phosphosulfolactate phosphohydrolase-like enzyme
VRIHVAFTPAEAAPAPVAVVVDVMRATSTIAQALASGWERVYCAPGIEEARALREALGEGLLGGERDAVQIPGFDLGASPREVREPRSSTLIMSTTNGTHAIVTSAGSCDTVLLGSLLNLDAVVSAVRERGEDVTVVCAGWKDLFAIDDAYPVPAVDRRHSRADVRAAGARGRHRLGDAGQPARRRPALLAHGRRHRRDRGLTPLDRGTRVRVEHVFA